MPNFLMRRERILPGPLKILRQAENRSRVPVTSLVLTSAVIAAGLLLMPQLSARLSVDPTPVAETASASHAEPEAVVSAASASPAPIAEATARSKSAVAPSIAPPAASASIPESSLYARASAETPAVTRSAAAPAKSAADVSLFQLDLLPVLRADALDTGAEPSAAPQPVSARGPSRKAIAANRGAPAQP